MGTETLQRAIDTLKPKRLIFFGGEPLLNKPLIEFGLAYGKDSGVDTFNIVSNGALITSEFLEKIKDYKVSFGISIDGIKESHNNTRGHFDLVVAGIELLREYKIPFSFRSTFTPETIKYMFESYEYLKSKSPWGIHLHLADSGSFQYSEQDFIEYEKQLILIRDSYLKDKSIVLRVGQSLQHTKRYCDAGIKYFCIDYDGSIYPCHRSVFIPNTKMGHIDTGIDMYKRNCYAQITRADLKCDPLCPILGRCDGTCYVANFVSNGNFYFPDRVVCKIKQLYAKVGSDIIYV